MKQALLFAIATSLLFGCTSIEKDARKRIEAFISENAHDANSYKFINLEKPDTLRASDSVKIMLNSKMRSLNLNRDLRQSYLSQIEFYEKTMADAPKYAYIFTDAYEKNKREAMEYNEMVKEDSTIIEELNLFLNSIEANPKLDKDLSITYVLNFRTKNLLGAYYKTNGKISFFPETQTWSEVEIAGIMDDDSE